MPAAVTYTTVLGQVLMENRGGIVTEFVPDPLGSVVKHKDSTGAYVHSAEYWPYGEIQTSTGNLPGPFAYCGTWGYYRDSASMTYVRARYYRPVHGRWMTVDRLWPREAPYNYARQNPVIFVDIFGMQVSEKDIQEAGSTLKDIAIGLVGGVQSSSCLQGFLDRVRVKGKGIPDARDLDKLRQCIAKCKTVLCVVNCSIKSGIKVDPESLDYYACCVHNSKNGHTDPCSTGKFNDTNRCCGVHYCLCVMTANRNGESGGTPDKQACISILCESQTTGEAGCENWSINM